MEYKIKDKEEIPSICMAEPLSCGQEKGVLAGLDGSGVEQSVQWNMTPAVGNKLSLF